MNDLRCALRSLARSPGFVAIAILTLGLGIGANTAAFSVVNEVLLRPLPYRDVAALERIYRATPQNGRGGVSPADYLDLRAHAGGYGEVSASAGGDVSLSAPGEPADLAHALRISDNVLSILEVQPALGRGFRPEETVPGNDRVLILSHPFWQERFGGDPGVIGRTVRVDGRPHEVVGVLPQAVNDWRHLGGFDVLRPLALTEEDVHDHASTWIRPLGRRAPAVSREQGAAFMAAFGRRLADERPDLHALTTWRTLPLEVAVAPDAGPPMLAMLLGLSLFVLLIACSNLANLLLARTIARAREFAVRGALGASRARLLRPLFLESLLLAVTGGICAIYFATWTNAWMRRYMHEAYDGVRGVVFAVDWRVIGWAFAACLVTAVVFGVAPALFALRLDLHTTLKSGGRGTTSTRGHARFRHALIVGQFALAMVLLAGAAVFAGAVHDLNRRQYGWRSEDVVSGSVVLPAAAYPAGKDVADFHRRALERIEALPGVASATVAWTMPFFGLAEPRKYVVAGRDLPPPGHEPVAVVNGVSARYFDTLATPLLSGRAFSERDTLDAPRVFIVNQAMARGLFGDESPLGRRIARAGGEALEWGEVVGVVADVGSVFPDRVPVAYQLYQPLAQEPRPVAQVAVRTAGAAPAAVLAGVRATLAALDADVAVRQLQPADTLIAKAMYQWGVLREMLSFLALLGLGLACLGIYGVIARTMAQRTGEFGIRLALGAQVSDIVRLVLASGARLALLGSALGVVGALALTRFLASFFPGLHTSAPPVLAAVTLLLVGVAQVASYIPARAAARISPTEALRAE
jgi:predicted permease